MMLPCRGCNNRLFPLEDFTVRRREGWDFYPGGDVYTAAHTKAKCNRVRVLSKAQMAAFRMTQRRAVGVR
jgi:hypothetical protein